MDNKFELTFSTNCNSNNVNMLTTDDISYQTNSGVDEFSQFYQYDQMNLYLVSEEVICTDTTSSNDNDDNFGIITVEPKVEPDSDSLDVDVEDAFTDNSHLNDLNSSFQNIDLKPHICKYCLKRFTREKALLSHEKIHECLENKVNTSKIQKISTKQQPTNVVIGNNKPKPVVITPSVKPAVTVTDEKPPGKYQCTECTNKWFMTKQKMQRHLWIHRKKAFTCACGISFELQNELDDHRLTVHADESPYSCADCGKNFASRQGLWEHNRYNHNGNTDSFTCTKCNKKFNSRQGFLIHGRTHSGQRPYNCKYCSKRFGDGGTLRKHELIHTNERPHKCSLCEKGFNQKVVLREHVRWVHASNKTDYPEPAPYVCLLCDYIVTDREELCTHIIKHSDQITTYTKECTRKKVSLLPEEETKNGILETFSLMGSKNNPDIVWRNRIIIKNIIAPKLIPKIIPKDDPEGFECYICNLDCTSKELLLSHLKQHI